MCTQLSSDLCPFAIHPDSDRLPSRSHSNRFDAADKGEDFDKAVADIKKEKED